MNAPFLTKTGRPVARREPIRADEAYPLAEFARRTGLGRNGMREARRGGLRVRRVGRLVFVLGSDWLRFLKGDGE